ISPSAERPVNPYCPLNEARRRLREQCALAAFPRRWPYGLESYFLVLGEPIIIHNSHILYDNISFRSEGSDVRYTKPRTCKLNLKLCAIRKVVKLNTVNKLQGHDLPFPKEPSRKNDLLVSFDIKFPEKLLTQSAKDILYFTLSN
ncbi:DnaJ protein like protein 1, partial [Trachymyrmex septentrionalis]